MTREIKITHAQVEQSLSELKTSVHSLELSLPSDIKGKNRLDMVTQLNEINTAFEDIVKSYQRILLNNEELTKQSIESLKAMDEKTASGIQLLK